MALSEKEIGENAQRMVERALLSEIRASGLHLSNSAKMDRKTKNKQPLTPLLKSSAHKRMNVDNTDQLFGIAVHLGKHGFVHNFGVNTTRKTHTATSKKGRLYTRKSHRFRLSSNKMINTAISKSGAIDYMAEKVTEARGEEVVSKIMGAFR